MNQLFLSRHRLSGDTMGCKVAFSQRFFCTPLYHLIPFPRKVFFGNWVELSLIGWPISPISVIWVIWVIQPKLLNRYNRFNPGKLIALGYFFIPAGFFTLLNVYVTTSYMAVSVIPIWVNLLMIYSMG